MVTDSPGPSSDRGGGPPPADRLYASRYLLAAVALVLLAGSVFFAVPVGFSLAAFLLLGLVAMFLPHARSDRRECRSGPRWSADLA